MVGVAATLCLSEVSMNKKKRKEMVGDEIVHLIILKKNSSVREGVITQKIWLEIEQDRNENTNIYQLRQN